MPGLTEPNQILKREDLADLIAIADMKATPFLTRAKKLKAANNTLFEWGVDAYSAPRTTGTVDGTDVTDYENAADQRARLKNHIQIWRRTAKVSRLSENVSDVAGIKSEIANATTKKIRELGRDMEATLLSDNDQQLEQGGAEYKTAGLGRWIDTTGPTVYPIPAAYRTPAAQIFTGTAITSIVEDTHLQGVLQAIFDTTGGHSDLVAFCGSVFRRRFTDMLKVITNTGGNASKARTFTILDSSETITESITVFTGDFGTIEVIPDPFIGWTASGPDTDRCYFADMDKVGIKWNQSSRAERLPDLGGGPRVLIEAVAGLQVDNPLGMGKIVPP